MRVAIRRAGVGQARSDRAPVRHAQRRIALSVAVVRNSRRRDRPGHAAVVWGAAQRHGPASACYVTPPTAARPRSAVAAGPPALGSSRGPCGWFLRLQSASAPWRCASACADASHRESFTVSSRFAHAMTARQRRLRCILGQTHRPFGARAVASLDERGDLAARRKLVKRRSFRRRRRVRTASRSGQRPDPTPPPTPC